MQVCQTQRERAQSSPGQTLPLVWATLDRYSVGVLGTEYLHDRKAVIKKVTNWQQSDVESIEIKNSYLCALLIYHNHASHYFRQSLSFPRLSVTL